MRQVSPAGWAGPAYPNSSTTNHSISNLLNCGQDGCLFNVTADSGEHENLAEAMPDVVASLGRRLDELSKGIWQNQEKGIDACPKNISGLCACWMAEHVYGGFMGILLNLLCRCNEFYLYTNCSCA